MTIIENYKLLKLLGKGSYGSVYEAKHLENNEKVAVKIEKSNKRSLFNEICVLNKLRNINQIPKIFNYGIYNDSYYFVMERLGMTIENFYYECNSNKKFLDLIIQTMVIIKNIQQNGIIHRDIKPDNIILNIEKTKVYIIDFGISKKYLDKYKNHKKKKLNNKIQGTVRYASIFNHHGIEITRRDDIISFLYSMIYILKGGLPWQNLNDDGKYLKILKKKQTITSEDLCHSLHKNFHEILDYCYTINYDEEPDYDYIILSLNNINNLFS